jgi:hypothetical protein
VGAVASMWDRSYLEPWRTEMETRVCPAQRIDAPNLGQGGVKKGQSDRMGMPAGGCVLGVSIRADPNGLTQTICVAPLEMSLRRTWPHYPPRASEKQKEWGDISCPFSGFLDDGHDYTY